MLVNKTNVPLSSCKLTVAITPTDFDQDAGSVELIEYLSVNGKRRLTNAAPGLNPCKSAYAAGTSLAATRKDYILVGAESVEPIAGVVELEGKISAQVDECASNGYLLDGYAEVTCCLGGDVCPPEKPPAAFDVVYMGFGSDKTCAEASGTHEVTTTGLHMMQSVYKGEGDNLRCFSMASLPWDKAATPAFYALTCDPDTGDVSLQTFGADPTCDPFGKNSKNVFDIAAGNCLYDKSSREYAKHSCQPLGQGTALSKPKDSLISFLGMLRLAASGATQALQSTGHD